MSTVGLVCARRLLMASAVPGMSLQLAILIVVFDQLRPITPSPQLSGAHFAGGGLA
jgi:hypothetical protein